MSSIPARASTPFGARTAGTRRRWWQRVDPMPMLALPATLALGFAFGLPLLMLLLASVRGPDGFTLASYVAFFRDPFHLQVLLNSV